MDRFFLTPQTSARNSQLGISTEKMTTHYSRKGLKCTMNGSNKSLDANLQESVGNFAPLHMQRAMEHRGEEQLTPANVPASLSRFTTCTVPASCRARSRFLNLRDSVKKSPTKSTAKVVGSCPTLRQPQIPWVPFSFNKVLVTVSGD